MSPDYVAEWIRKAEADRLAARRALRDTARHPGQSEIACFHAQQCAEKYLKALLAMKNMPIPRTHDLWALALKLKRRRFPAHRMEDDLRRLNQYGVDIRYPGACATTPEARKAVGAMRNIAETARALLRA